MLFLLGDVLLYGDCNPGNPYSSGKPLDLLRHELPDQKLTEQVAVKINDLRTSQRPNSVPKDCYAGKNQQRRGLELHALLENVPYSSYRNVQRNTVVLPSDETTDFDYPEDYNQWMARFRSA